MRRSIGPEQILQIVVKVLKRKVYPEPFLILSQQFANGAQVVRIGLLNDHAGRFGHMPVQFVPGTMKSQPPPPPSRLIDVNVLTFPLASHLPEVGFDQETTRLAARAREGDAEAFSALIELHHRAARRVAVAALGNLAEADEAVQDACFVAWRRIDRLEEPGAFRAWLLRITWRKALDRRRSIKGLLRRFTRESDESVDPIQAIPARGAGPDDELLMRERDRVLTQMIRSLPPRLRDPLLLSASGEHRYDEIATMLDIPLGTVKWRMVEARRVLREKLERLGFGDRV